MSPVPATSRRTRNSLWARTAARLTGRSAVAALVAALVVGILGMHALASHGASPAATVPTPSSTMSMTSTAAMTSAHEAAMASGDSHDGHAHSAATQSLMAAPEASVEVSADAGSGSGHGMASMVMLCVVMLAAAALTLLALLAKGFLRPLQSEAFMPAAVRVRALRWVRCTGPPHEWQFSVIRC